MGNIDAPDGDWMARVQRAVRDPHVELHINLPGGDFVGGAQRGLISQGNATETELSWVARAAANGERELGSIQFRKPGPGGS